MIISEFSNIIFDHFDKANPLSSLHFLSSPAIKYEVADSLLFLNCSMFALVGLNKTFSWKLYTSSRNSLTNDCNNTLLFEISPILMIPSDHCF